MLRLFIGAILSGIAIAQLVTLIENNPIPVGIMYVLGAIYFVVRFSGKEN